MGAGAPGDPRRADERAQAGVGHAPSAQSGRSTRRTRCEGLSRRWARLKQPRPATLRVPETTVEGRGACAPCAAWHARPFASVDALHAAMVDALMSAPIDTQLLESPRSRSRTNALMIFSAARASRSVRRPLK